jgi:hypothetical protein
MYIIHRLRGIIQINRIININLTPDATALDKPPPSATLPLNPTNAYVLEKRTRPVPAHAPFHLPRVTTDNPRPNPR